MTAQTSPWLQIEGLPGVQAKVAIATDPAEYTPLQALIDLGRFVPQEGQPRSPQARLRVWFQVDVLVPPGLVGQVAALRVLPALIDRAELHLADGSIQRSGLRLPAAQRTKGHMPMDFDVPLNAPTVRFYLGVGSSVQQLTHMSLLSQTALKDVQAAYSFSQGSYYGAVLLMLVLAMIGWAVSPDGVYRSFVAYTASSLAFSLFLNGYATSYLLPDSPELLQRLAIVSFALLVASTVWFMSAILDCKHRTPRLWRVLWVVQYLALVGCAGALHLRLITVLTPILWITHLVVGLLMLALCLQQAVLLKTRQAWLLFSANFAFNVLEKPALLAMLGILPMSAWMPEIGKLGLIVQMLLIQLLLMLRLRQQREIEHQAQVATQEADRQRLQRQNMAHFLGVFGHEVRTPLAVIDAVAQSLQILPGAEAPEVKKRHLSIRKAVAHMSQLAHRALAEERIESENYALRCQAVDVTEVMAETLTLHGVDVNGWLGDATLPLSVGELESGAVEISVHGALPTLWADPGMLNVALSNLIDNARKYATPGSTIKLVAEALQPGAEASPGVALHVVNEGANLSEDEVSQVFDKYWRKDGARVARGVGFGLHMVQKIMMVHGGMATARMLPGGAVCFSLHIPAGAVPAA